MSSPSSSAAAPPGIAVEIVSEEEMAIIEAALAAAAARPLLSSAGRRGAQLSCAAYSAAGHGGDIEDTPPQRRALLSRFRDRRALAVTDITATVGWPQAATLSHSGLRRLDRAVTTCACNLC
jgi:exonuclease V